MLVANRREFAGELARLEGHIASAMISTTAAIAEMPIVPTTTLGAWLIGGRSDGMDLTLAG